MPLRPPVQAPRGIRHCKRVATARSRGESPPCCRLACRATNRRAQPSFPGPAQIRYVSTQQRCHECRASPRRWAGKAARRRGDERAVVETPAIWNPIVEGYRVVLWRAHSERVASYLGDITLANSLNLASARLARLEKSASAPPKLNGVSGQCGRPIPTAPRSANRSARHSRCRHSRGRRPPSWSAVRRRCFAPRLLRQNPVTVNALLPSFARDRLHGDHSQNRSDGDDVSSWLLWLAQREHILADARHVGGF